MNAPEKHENGGVDAALGAIAPLTDRGWAILPGLIDPGIASRVAGELEPALARRDAIRIANAVEGRNDGTLHHLLADAPVFVDVLAAFERIDPLVRAFFGGNYILNSYGGVVNVRDSKAYVHNVHRDIRFSSVEKRFMLNSLVMIDDFTLDNGATYLLSGSHTAGERPEDADFFAHADRAVGNAGSVLCFDSRIWHATGSNVTPKPRRALTLTFSCPFFKPQLDYPRLVGDRSMRTLSPYLRQVIGFNARVPATLDEFYRPVDQRFYKRGQDD
jgi:ectoine hydroxylase-related dioxygenase (phytanoyl-CoA dioxygenase family)